MKKSLGAKTLAVPTPAWVVGSYDDEGRPNGMVAAWGGICCSKPVMMTVSLREATYSHGCIKQREAFTVSVCSRDQAAQMDFFGTVSGRNKNKFEEVGLTAAHADLVDAPYVEEFPMVIECKLAHTFELGLHTQFVGEVLDVKVDEDCLDESGNPDVAKIAPVIYSPGNRGYYALGDYIGKAFSIGKK
jgi:flavin reductase (DIM6/NTAB) family NADH-FMN oxidoreductase RutF